MINNLFEEPSPIKASVKKTQKKKIEQPKTNQFDTSGYQPVLTDKASRPISPIKNLVEPKKQFSKAPMKKLQDMTDEEKLSFRQQYLEDKLEVARLTKEIEEEHKNYNSQEMFYPSTKSVTEVKSFKTPPEGLWKVFKLVFMELEGEMKDEI